MDDKIENDVCRVCEQYSQAGKEISGVLCPWCKSEMFPEDPFENLKEGQPIYIERDLNDEDIEVIGEHNGTTKQHFIKAHVRRCPNCNKHVGFIPTKICWNANHDILYPEQTDK